MHLKSHVALVATLATHAWAASINWYPCKQNATAPVTCGSLAVPLDYSDKDAKKTIDLELLKFNATKEPCKGSILFNPGGPGESTREFLANFAQEMLIATGGHYNLIAFEPRGLGNTIPFSCYESATDRLAQSLKLPLLTNASDTTLGETWSAMTAASQSCYETMKDTGSFIGTAFVARDMMQIVDALGEDGKLRFWGFSYGTILGATAVSMFPDRMDKIILDGVVNVPEWIRGSNQEAFVQADDSLKAFFKDCLDAPETCALHREGKTADDLYNEFFQLLENIKYKPLVLGSNATTDIADYTTVKLNVLSGVKTGILLSIPTAAYLNAIYEKDLETFKKVGAVFTGGSAKPTYPNNGPEAMYGIQCSDVTLRTDDYEGLKPQIDYYYKHSQLYGDSWGGIVFGCAQWKMEAKERFSGPFKAKTKTPVLFINSPLDPATPMVSAKNMSQGYEGSVILQHNGIAHCSMAHPSTCVIKATQDYFNDGKLPEPGTICKPDFNFLSNHTTLEIYQMADKAK